jgi:hypothetical protein
MYAKQHKTAINKKSKPKHQPPAILNQKLKTKPQKQAFFNKMPSGNL